MMSYGQSCSLKLTPCTRDDLPWSVILVYFSCFGVVSILAFSSNDACLFYDWDGVSWYLAMDYMREFARPWEGSVDPVQGMFGSSYLGYRPGLPLDWLSYAVPALKSGKVGMNVFYAM